MRRGGQLRLRRFEPVPVPLSLRGGLALGECQQRSRAVEVTGLHANLDLVRERDLGVGVVDVRCGRGGGLGGTLRRP